MQLLFGCMWTSLVQVAVPKQLAKECVRLIGKSKCSIPQSRKYIIDLRWNHIHAIDLFWKWCCRCLNDKLTFDVDFNIKCALSFNYIDEKMLKVRKKQMPTDEMDGASQRQAASSFIANEPKFDWNSLKLLILVNLGWKMRQYGGNDNSAKYE